MNHGTLTATHAPGCPAIANPAARACCHPVVIPLRRTENQCGYCHLIARVRADERERCIGEIRDWCKDNPRLCGECGDVIAALRATP